MLLDIRWLTRFLHGRKPLDTHRPALVAAPQRVTVAPRAQAA